MNERRRLATLLLGASGVLVGHAIAYQTLGLALGPTHSYMGRVAQILLPLGLGAGALIALRVARTVDLNRQHLSFGLLALVQVLLFIAQETTEALLSSGGIGQLRPSVVVVGLASQLLVASALYWAIGTVALAASKFATVVATYRPNTATEQVTWLMELVPGRLPRSDVHSRGPPSLFGI